MKRKELNSICRSTCEYLMSRNNDINGYWGLGVLCRLAVLKNIFKMSFQIKGERPISIYGCELTESVEYSKVLTGLGVEKIEGRLSFFSDGRYSDGSEKYTCGICIGAIQGGRMGIYMSYVSCWPHNPSKERKRIIAGKIYHS